MAKVAPVAEWSGTLPEKIQQFQAFGSPTKHCFAARARRLRPCAFRLALLWTILADR